MRPRIIRICLRRRIREGTLADIAAAICPCSKLYAFIGREITRAFPDHHHLYSEWINTYSGGSIDESTAILDKIIDEVATEENKESLRFYYSEAMRLEFEFFNQQSHVPTLSTSNIFLVGHGDIACSEKVVECPHVADGTVDREGLATVRAEPRSRREEDVRDDGGDGRAHPSR